jgi:hypothetical protein
MSTLAERSVLMRLSIGLPGEARQDKSLTADVKSEHALGSGAGKWVKTLYPPEALEPIKKLDNEAREYHATVTLPYDAGIGILPAALIQEYSDKMRQFAGERAHLVESHFLAKYDQWVDWARVQHNGTFDASLYPGAEALREKFSFRAEPTPVPGSEQFSAAVASLLGTDVEGVNQRVAEATLDAQRELMRRLMEPVAAMAKKLAEEPKTKADGTVKDITFRDSLVGNLKAIVDLAPKLNLTGDAQIDAFIVEIEPLTRYSPQVLRDDKGTRAEARQAAEALLQKLSGYQV